MQLPVHLVCEQWHFAIEDLRYKRSDALRRAAVAVRIHVALTLPYPQSTGMATLRPSDSATKPAVLPLPDGSVDECEADRRSLLIPSRMS
jgi:hypothetical protein